MGGITQACRSVERWAEIIAIAELGNANMDRSPNTYRCGRRPGFIQQRTLDQQRRLCGDAVECATQQVPEALVLCSHTGMAPFGVVLCYGYHTRRAYKKIGMSCNFPCMVLFRENLTIT
jgi:hypothetical protein